MVKTRIQTNERPSSHQQSVSVQADSGDLRKSSSSRLGSLCPGHLSFQDSIIISQADVQQRVDTRFSLRDHFVPLWRGDGGSSPGRFKARHLLAAGPQERATACLRRHNSSSTLGETIQSVRLAQPLYSSIQALVCLCWQIYSTCVLSCLSPLPHTFGPAAVAVALAELPAAPLFSAVFIHRSRRFRPTRANDFKQTLSS